MSTNKPKTLKALADSIADTTGITAQRVKTILQALSGEVLKAMGPKGPGVFVQAGVFKIVRIVKPATKERKGTNPFTGEPCTFKARPARVAFKLRVLKEMKSLKVS